jgi:endogenous inhibitor of DNA gyrase (YacG/DUF329 family)
VPATRTCPRCDAEFTTDHPTQKWCSKRCRIYAANTTYYRRHLAQPARTVACGHCGQPFTTARQNARYCSDRCRTYAARQRDRDSDHERAEPARIRIRILDPSNDAMAQYAVPRWRSRPPADTRRARAVARLMLGGDPESIAEALGLDLEEVCQLAERVAEHGLYA